MSLKLLDQQYDDVIGSKYITAVTNYSYALEKLVPLINRFEQQRYTLRENFYQKLEKDIIDGCIMPPLTLAIKDENAAELKEQDVEEYINNNISIGFVLDGIQRLNTLQRIGIDNLNGQRSLYINILISDSMDKLLYRMITLNNGQRPMSTRHQVEILASNLYDFENLDVNYQTEKEQQTKRINGAFKKSDIITSYLAFVTKSINIDNQKIIESKLDELITNKIMTSNVTKSDIEFSNVIDLVTKLIEDNNIKKWFKVTNNLVGFTAGISDSFNYINTEDHDSFYFSIQKFEEAFSAIDVSRIKLGLARRKSVKFFIERYLDVRELDVISLTDLLSQEI
ncbi:hypothetical protein OBCHQ24_04865 [Oceanobacillus iheyensis]|nr:hypothetical protein OBCHQ24_04865 [Oceanobacillus iheyensis]